MQVAPLFDNWVEVSIDHFLKFSVGEWVELAMDGDDFIHVVGVWGVDWFFVNPFELQVNLKHACIEPGCKRGKVVVHVPLFIRCDPVD